MSRRGQQWQPSLAGTCSLWAWLLVRWRKKKSWDICRYQLVEVEGEGGTAVLAGW